MAVNADRINVELRAPLAGLSRDLTGAARQIEGYEKRIARSARSAADTQVEEARRAARGRVQLAARYGWKSDFRPPAGSALARTAEVAALAESPSAFPNLQPVRAIRGARLRVDWGKVKKVAEDIGKDLGANALYDGLKDVFGSLTGDDTPDAEESYKQIEERFGRTPEEAAGRIRSMSADDLEQEKGRLSDARKLQEEEREAVRQRFLSMFELSIGEMRDAVAFGLSKRSDEEARQYLERASQITQAVDDIKSGKAISEVSGKFPLLEQLSPNTGTFISEDSSEEQKALGRVKYIDELLGLIAANLAEAEKAAEGTGNALGNAAEDAKILATAVAPPAASTGGFLAPVDIDGATTRQTPGASSGSSGGVPIIETHRPARAGLEAVRTKSDEQNKTADEDAIARQKELAGAIIAVGDVFSNSIKGAKDFNDALDSIGLGLLDLAAKGLFGQGALGGAFNQLLGTGPGGAGLLSLLGGSSDGSSGGGLFSGIGSLVGNLFGGIFGRASGGQVLPGQLYEVGEAGREWFAPSVPGQVIPNHVIKGAGGGGNGANQPITFNISMAGANGDRTIAEIAAAAVKKGLTSVPEINRQHRIRFA